jgi:hypothetical protein
MRAILATMLASVAVLVAPSTASAAAWFCNHGNSVACINILGSGTTVTGIEAQYQSNAWGTKSGTAQHQLHITYPNGSSTTAWSPSRYFSCSPRLGHVKCSNHWFAHQSWYPAGTRMCVATYLWANGTRRFHAGWACATIK